MLRRPFCTHPPQGITEKESEDLRGMFVHTNPVLLYVVAARLGHAPNPIPHNPYPTLQVLAITTLFVFAYCLVFMRLSPKLGLLTSTLSIAAVPLFWFGMFFMTIFTSYALAFHLAFGMDVGAFSSVGTSMYDT